MTATHATTDRSVSVTTQYSSRRALTSAAHSVTGLGCFSPADLGTLTPASSKPVKTIRLPHVPPNPAGQPRPPASPRPPSLSVLFSTALLSSLSPLLFRSSFTTA